uniref:Uncharacterized protein n=1 Tax=Opuntia streptacantha TaxID=393608 RepID=A0A7C9DZS1_OPUST
MGLMKLIRVRSKLGFRVPQLTAARPLLFLPRPMQCLPQPFGSPEWSPAFVDSHEAGGGEADFYRSPRPRCPCSVHVTPAKPPHIGHGGIADRPLAASLSLSLSLRWLGQGGVSGVLGEEGGSSER